MATYMFRITVPGSEWTERRLRWSFWLLNIGLAVMVLLSVMPVGFLQLEVGFTESYAASRSLAFYNTDVVQLLFWLRVPGDVMIIVGSIIFGVDAVDKVRKQRSAVTGAESNQPVATRVLAEDDD